MDELAVKLAVLERVLVELLLALGVVMREMPIGAIVKV